MLSLGARHSCSGCFSESVFFSGFRSLPLEFCGLFLFSSSFFSFGVCFTCTFCSSCFKDYFCFFLAVFHWESRLLSFSSFLYFLGIAFWDPSASLIRICCRLLGGPTRTTLVFAY